MCVVVWNMKAQLSKMVADKPVLTLSKEGLPAYRSTDSANTAPVVVFVMMLPAKCRLVSAVTYATNLVCSHLHETGRLAWCAK